MASTIPASSMRTKTDRNYVTKKIGEYVHLTYGDMALVIDPSWTDAEISEEWPTTIEAHSFERTELRKYSARQLREEQPEWPEYFAEDGALAAWVMIAEPGKYAVEMETHS
jgi:hypothetical protein